MTYTLKIERDEYPCNPREEFDNVGAMVCWHSRYNLGDKQPKEDAGDWLRNLAAEAVNADDPDCIPDEHVQRILDKHFVILPVYAYEHGGITISTGAFSCPWDSGQVGYIYCTLADVQREWDGDRDKAEAYLRAEVETYDQYLTGDVWGYTVEDEDGEHVDSCGGFFGEEYCRDEGQNALDWYQKKDRAEYAKRYAETIGYLPSMHNAVA